MTLTIRVSAILSFTLLLSACASIFPTKTPTPPLVASLTTKSNEPTELSLLLEAEFTLQRKGPANALPLYQALAEQYRRIDAIKKTTQLAIITQNQVALMETLNIWIQTEPSDVQPYSMLFNLHMDDQKLDRALNVFHIATKHHIEPVFAVDYIDHNLRNPDAISASRQLLAKTQLTDKLPPNSELLASTSSTMPKGILTQKLMALRFDFYDGHYERVIQTSPTLINESPKEEQEQIFILLAGAFDELEQPKSAKDTIESGLERFPNSHRLITRHLKSIIKLDGIDAAIIAFEAREMPRFLHQQVGLNLAQEIAQSEPNKALALLDALPRDGGLSEQIHYLSAQLLYQLKQPSEAIKRMSEVYGNLAWSATQDIAQWLYEIKKQAQINDIVITRTKHQEEIGYVLAIAQLHQQNDEAKLALDLINKGLSFAPDNLELQYRKALLLDTLGLTKDAIIILKAVVEQSPNNANFLNALGYSLMISEPRQLDQAMAYIEKAYSLDSANPAIIDSLGWGMFLKGDLASALNYLQDAWSRLKDPEIGAHLGEVLWLTHAQSEAISIWRIALSVDDKYPALRQTIERFAPELLDTPELLETPEILETPDPQSTSK